MHFFSGAALVVALVSTIDALITSHIRIPIEQKLRRHNRRPWSLGVGNETLTNVLEVAYVGPVYVGTPPQKFMLDFDTGSGDTWMPSKYCNKENEGCKAVMEKHLVNSYDHKASSTYIPNGNQVNVTYGLGYMRGVESIDTLSIGGLKIANQPFVEANEFDAQSVDEGIAGLVGISWQGDMKMPFMNLFEQHKLPALFSFYMNK
uniref:Lysosomal aspartic protease n=4 Tax=Lygus hesperus TaxID=30085 RepID=A0A146L0G4_LYGHE